MARKKIKSDRTFDSSNRKKFVGRSAHVFHVSKSGGKIIFLPSLGNKKIPTSKKKSDDGYRLNGDPPGL